MLLKVDKHEFNTILAALRFWQRAGNMDDMPETEIAEDDEAGRLGDIEIDALCERLNTTTITFAECTSHFAKEYEGHKAIAIAEQQPFVRDGECEIDGSPIVSEGDDNGAYVMAWVWAPYDDEEEDEDDD